MIFRSLQYRNYRLYFIGQGISLVGSWIQQIAVSWFVYKITNSTFLLGFIGFIGQIPSLVISPFAGVVADKMNKYKILIITQFLAMFQAFILAFLVLSERIQTWHIFLLSLFLGLINAFETPVRQSFIIHMIDNKEDLGNAIALNSAMFNGARLAGPAIAGLIIAVYGEGICFLINSFSFIAAIVSLFMLKINTEENELIKMNIISELKIGFNYVLNSIPIKYILLFVGFISLMGMPYTILMPVFAKNILHGGPNTLGLLMGSAGAGAFLGAIYLAAQKNNLKLLNNITINGFALGISLICFSLSGMLLLSMFLLFIAGFNMLTLMASSNTFLQITVDDSLRGRVMSLFTLAFMGMIPFGSLFAGIIASLLNARIAIFISGLFSVIGTLIFVRKLSLIKERKIIGFA